MDFYARFHKRRYTDLDGSPMHDPVCIAHLIDPTLMDVHDAFIEVDCTTGPSWGRTNVDWRGREHFGAPNAKVGLDIDGPRFAELIVERISTSRMIVFGAIAPHGNPGLRAARRSDRARHARARAPARGERGGGGDHRDAARDAPRRPLRRRALGAAHRAPEPVRRRRAPLRGRRRSRARRRVRADAPRRRPAGARAHVRDDRRRAARRCRSTGAPASRSRFSARRRWSSRRAAHLSNGDHVRAGAALAAATERPAGRVRRERGSRPRPHPRRPVRVQRALEAVRRRRPGRRPAERARRARRTGTRSGRRTRSPTASGRC